MNLEEGYVDEEMEPDPENRVTLSSKVCPYGQPIPRVVHRCTEIDRRSLDGLPSVPRSSRAQNLLHGVMKAIGVRQHDGVELASARFVHLS